MTHNNTHASVLIDVPLVAQLITAQFPEWANLPVTPVELSGCDNRTFHLGNEMTVRLPSARRYAAQVRKEHNWLPKLAPHLPLPIPVPLAMGKPSHEYPWHWSIYQWLEGDNATIERIDDLDQFAGDLAAFLKTLQRVDPSDGPHAGRHNFFRGGPLSIYDAETRDSIAALGNHLDIEAVTAVWETALQSVWDGIPVWVHGDVASGNLLVRRGRLSAVIDFGCTAIGDPACDMALAWTLLSATSRAVFRNELSVDDGTWARGRGWTLWKALITVRKHRQNNPQEASEAQRVIEELLTDYDN
jgi:aminoglycoside phosphotransferase (APT) family kinase protein